MLELPEPVSNVVVRLHAMKAAWPVCEPCVWACGSLLCRVVESMWLVSGSTGVGEGERMVSGISVAPVCVVRSMDEEEERGMCTGEPP